VLFVYFQHCNYLHIEPEVRYFDHKAIKMHRINVFYTLMWMRIKICCGKLSFSLIQTSLILTYTILNYTYFKVLNCKTVFSTQSCSDKPWIRYTHDTQFKRVRQTHIQQYFFIVSKQVFENITGMQETFSR
jgi:hypothetical protein